MSTQSIHMSTERIGIIAAIAAAAVVIIVGALYFEGVFGTGQLYCVKMGDKWGYVNTAGKYVINPQFDEARVFDRKLQSGHRESSAANGASSTRTENTPSTRNSTKRWSSTRERGLPA